MPLIACPDCGAHVSDTAVVCPQCGFPLRRDVLARAAAGRVGGSSPGNTAGIIIGVVVAGVVGLVIVGILAALAIPRFAGATQRAKERDGERLLKQVFTLENAYWANNGVYVASVDELASVGWLPSDTARFYEAEVRLTPGREAIVCLEARPKRGADVQPLSMDSVGTLYHDEGCSGQTLAESRGVSRSLEGLTGPVSDAEVIRLLLQVHRGVAEYRAEHGRDPTQLGQVLQHVRFTPASTEISLSLGRRGGRLCVTATPHDPRPLGPHVLSLDGDGQLYQGGTCSGPAIEVDSTSSDSSSDAPAPKPVDDAPR